MNLVGFGITLTVGAVIGFFVGRANGEGTKLDALADKVDAKWDEKVKPLLEDLKKEIETLKEKTKK